MRSLRGKNMLWVEKIKENVKGVLRIHPVSIITFLIASIIAGISGDADFNKKMVRECFEFGQTFFFCLTPAFVLCEANFAYKKKIGKISSLKEVRKSAVYLVVTIIAVVVSGIFAYITGFGAWDRAQDFCDFFYRIFWVYLAVCVLSAFFFMYKKNGESFEVFGVKAFLGGMKAGLVHGIITLGAFCIMWVFDVLFFDLGCETFILWLVFGIVGFPAYLIALSAPGEKITKFSKVVMGYVFPGILAAAFVIVYAYIIKILVTWSFPSNQVFSIMTALFCSGIMIWTMAQGCTEGKILSALRIMPLLFIPFIVVQIMCLVMRINQYGMTGSRYLGVLLIIFEILYEGYYIVILKREKGIGGILMPVLLLFVVIYFLVPGINVYAVITNSQKAVVSGYVHMKMSGAEMTSQQLARARSGYNEIMENGGLEGKHYLKKLYAESSKEEIEDILETSSTYSSVGRSYFVYVSDRKGEIDIEGYKHLCRVMSSIYDDTDYFEVPIWNEISDFDQDEPVVTADLSGIINKLRELELEDAESAEKSAVLHEPIAVEGGRLYIDELQFTFYKDSPDNEIEDLVIEGYYLY